MPMCDIYLPSGSLSEEAESTLITAVSDCIVRNELRRTAEFLGEDEKAFNQQRLEAMAWIYVLRPERMYAAGKHADAPHYKFVMIVPKGYVNERFTSDVTRDIYKAVELAEGDKPNLGLRIRVFINEVEDGKWGVGDHATGMSETVKAIRS